MANPPRNQKSPSSGGSTSPTKGKEEILVERDANHVRLKADEVIPAGRTGEIKLFVMSRGRRPAALGRFEANDDHGTAGAMPVRFQSYATEVAEISLPPVSAVNLALRLLGLTIGKDGATPELLKNAIDGIIEDYHQTIDKKKGIAGGPEA